MKGRIIGILMCAIILTGLLPEGIRSIYAAEAVISVTADEKGNISPSFGYSFDGSTLTLSKDHLFKLNITKDIEIVNYGEIVSGEVESSKEFINHGTISDGYFYRCSLTNKGTLSGGHFNTAVANYGEIKGGYFAKKVVNNGKITGGAFGKTVANSKKLTGGIFIKNPENLSGGSIDGITRLSEDKIHSLALSDSVSGKLESAKGADYTSLAIYGKKAVSGDIYRYIPEKGKQPIGLYLFKKTVNPPTEAYIDSSIFNEVLISDGGRYYSFTMPDYNSKIYAQYIRSNTENKPKTETIGIPGNLRWEKTSATWNSVKGAHKYSVELCCNGKILTQVTASDTCCDFAEIMTEGNFYYFRVRSIVKGKEDRYGEYSDYSDSLRYKKPTLSAPENLRWNNSKAEWDKVDGAVGYGIRLYRNGTIIGGEISLSKKATSYDFYDLIKKNGAGTYTFRVRAEGEDEYSDYSESKEYHYKNIAYTVSCSAKNITLTPIKGKLTVNAGESISFKLAAEKGYHLNNIKVQANGRIISAEKDIYTIKNIDDNIKITVSGVEKCSMNQLKSDKNGHWYQCRVCGTKGDIKKHEWKYRKTESSKDYYYCDCGAEMSEQTNKTFAVKFVGYEGYNTNVLSGDKIPTFIPQKAGCSFEGWYREATFKTLQGFNDAVTSDITLYPKWGQVKEDISLGSGCEMHEEIFFN